MIEQPLNVDRWAERIYKESDVGRGIATTGAGIAGLTAYLYFDDWVIAAFVTIILFPVIRITASSIHSRLERSRERSLNEGQLQELFANLGTEEKLVIESFVQHGGSVISWSRLNRSSLNFSEAGIESLMSRGVLHNTVTADGMREAFALDTEIFDYGQKVFIQAKEF